MKKNEKCYTNRELSWLQFNERVLNEAGNPRVPLAERMTFASIYQTNLDEFFMVRVGTLMMQMNAKEKVIENKTGMTSEEQVKEILARVCLLEKKRQKFMNSSWENLSQRESGLSILTVFPMKKEDFLNNILTHILHRFYLRWSLENSSRFRSLQISSCMQLCS